MQHHPFTDHLRAIGLLIGATLFIFMVYRTGQTASTELAGNKTSRYLQSIASSALAPIFQSFGPNSTLRTLALDDGVRIASKTTIDKTAKPVAKDNHQNCTKPCEDTATSVALQHRGNDSQKKTVTYYNRSERQ